MTFFRSRSSNDLSRDNDGPFKRRRTGDEFRATGKDGLRPDGNDAFIDPPSVGDNRIKGNRRQKKRRSKKLVSRLDRDVRTFGGNSVNSNQLGVDKDFDGLMAPRKVGEVNPRSPLQVQQAKDEQRRAQTAEERSMTREERREKKAEARRAHLPPPAGEKPKKKEGESSKADQQSAKTPTPINEYSPSPSFTPPLGEVPGFSQRREIQRSGFSVKGDKDLYLSIVLRQYVVATEGADATLMAVGEEVNLGSVANPLYESADTTTYPYYFLAQTWDYVRVEV